MTKFHSSVILFTLNHQKKKKKKHHYLRGEKELIKNFNQLLNFLPISSMLAKFQED